jgi:hypothetical protein
MFRMLLRLGLQQQQVLRPKQLWGLCVFCEEKPL